MLIPRSFLVTAAYDDLVTWSVLNRADFGSGNGVLNG